MKRDHYHFFGCLIIAHVLCFFMPMSAAFALTVIGGLLKEVWDEFKPGATGASFQDFILDVIGAVVGVAFFDLGVRYGLSA